MTKITLTRTPVSIYRNSKDNTGTICTLDAIYKRIVSGGKGLDEKTKNARALSQTDKAKYRVYKTKEFPAVTFAGTFTRRNAQGLKQHSGMLVLDLDELPRDKIPESLAALAQRGDIVLAFISPSGAGIKIVVRVNPTPTNDPEHKAAYQAALDHFHPFLEELDISFNVDTGTKDLPRLCFLAHHPQAIYNPETTAIQWDREAYQAERENGKSGGTSKGKSGTASKQTAPALLDVDFSQWQADTTFDLIALNYIHPDKPVQTDPDDLATRKEGYGVWVTVGMAIYNESLPLEIWDAWSQAGGKYSENDPDALQQKWDSFSDERDKQVKWGTIVEFAKVNGYTPPQKQGEYDNGKRTISLFTPNGERKQQGTLIDEVFETLCEVNDPPTFFQNGNEWVEILENKNSISTLKADAFRHRLADKFNWTSRNKEGNPTVCNVPKEIAGGVENHKRRHARIPKLERVINHPILFEDGRILEKRGYISEYNCYLLSDFDVQLCDSVDEARETLMKPFEDFIFESDKDRATAFAYLFTLLLREWYTLVPFFAIVSHKGGTGKGLLVKNLYRIAEGADLDASTWDKSKWDDTEIRRQIIGELMEGQSGVLIDNVPDGYTVKGAAFEVLATTEFFKGKILYRTERPAYRTWPVWMFTGNNIQFGGTLQRRVQIITITTDVEDPHLRTLPDLNSHVKQYRDTMLNACLTIFVEWLAKDAPTKDVSLGSFEKWARTIGGILDFAGIFGFDPAVIERSDEDSAIRAFIIDLFEAFNITDFNSKDILTAAREETFSLEGIVDDIDDQNASRIIARSLRTLCGQLWTRGDETIKLVRSDTTGRLVNYAFEIQDDSDDVPL